MIRASFLLVPIMLLLTSGRAMPQEKATPEPAPSLTAAQITAQARDSIVTIHQIGRGGEQEGLGTGFVLSRTGLIATNRHVIGNARRIEVHLADGTKHEVTEVHATDAVLDLAIIRIDQQGLKPLPLGDATALEQGAPLIAIGHPQGLQYSVVEGVLSATREIDGSDMLQIAIPVEEGNSGGPVMDLQGRVQGIMTMKSAITQNLGFAHPVNDLKRLLGKPNPVPMSRWLTIGKLDDKVWQPVLGGRWTQHAGVIMAETPGSGFGGRSLCLYQTAPPEPPYEISVTVKLDSEEGAAGLAFSADGQERHYGFYPSGGKLRLTRFDGPDVLSWKILSDTPSKAYLPGQWNTLRVRVEKDRLLCYVNDELVTEQPDSVTHSGHAGLCKFRQTVAQFKNFRLGTDLASPTLAPALAQELQANLQSYLTQPASDRSATMEKLLMQPTAARQALNTRVKALEQEAASLRELEKKLHRQQMQTEISKLLLRPADQTELLHAALLVAKHDQPDLDVASYLSLTARMADELRQDPAVKQGGASAARRLVTYLFTEGGFHGSRGDAIDNFSNSYLNEVLDDREGIPISLAIVYLEMARLLGIQSTYGVGLPGKFMVAFQETNGDTEPTTTYVDVFDGGKRLTQAEMEAHILRFAGQPVTPEQLAPATPRAIILRLIYNLASYSKRPDQSLPYLDLILAIEPTAASERLNRALFRVQQGDIPAAKKDLEYLLENEPAELDLRRIEQLYRSL